MTRLRGDRGFQWSLRTVLWLTFIVGVLCMAPGVWWFPPAGPARGLQPSALTRPLFACLVAYLVVHWLIRHDRP
jgi:hypothetical protein